MKEKSAPIELSPARQERDYYRNLFWNAYSRFSSKSVASTPALLPSDTTSYSGGPHDPAWEKWARWRAEFQKCGESVLQAEQLIIFRYHMCFDESDSRHLSVRKTIERIHSELGEGAIGMYLFYSTKEIIAEKVGRAIEASGIWPLYDGAGGGYFE